MRKVISAALVLMMIASVFSINIRAGKAEAQVNAEETAKNTEADEEQKAVAAKDKLLKITERTPVLTAPEANQVFTDADFTKGPRITFAWKEIEGAMAYRFVIKNEAGKALLVKTLNTNRYLLSDRISLLSADGIYEWSVTALTKIDNKTYASKTSSRKLKIQLLEVKAANVDTSNLVTGK